MAYIIKNIASTYFTMKGKTKNGREMVEYKNTLYLTPQKKKRVELITEWYFTILLRALMSILQSTHLRFTDCQFLNDKSEYTHIHIPLKQAFEEIKDSLHDDYMSGLIQEYLDHGYQYSELIQEKPDVGFKGLRMYEMRYLCFLHLT